MTYEYVCTACGHAWEAEQPISAAPLKTCPSCNAESAKRQISGGAGFILKGGGWYSDLYSSTPKKPTTESSSSESSSAVTPTTSTDSGSKGSDSTGTSATPSTGTKPAGTPSAA
jgi:putative FmdB family regulatory protein